MTPEQLAKEIIDNPTNWGMYSIADEIHKMLSEQSNKISELQKENERLKGLIEKIYYDYGIGYIGRGIEIEDFKKKYNL